MNTDRSSVSPLTVNLLIALLCLVWGSTWLVIKGGLADLPPFTAAGLRFTLAGAVMILVASLLRRREGGRRPGGGLVAVIGVLNFTVSYGIIYWCETVLPSGLVSVLWAVYPLVTAVGGHTYLRTERLGRRQGLGFLVGFVGVATLFLTDLRSMTPDAVPAALVLLVSPVVCAIGSLIIKRHGGQVSSLLLNRDGMLVGAALLLGLALVLERDSAFTWTATAVFSIFYLALAGTVLTFGVYFWLLRYSDASRLSLIAYVTPALAMFLGWAFGDETVDVSTLTGAGLILAGVYLVVRR